MKIIPSPHESGAVVDYTKRALDHHPLTKDEIAALLNEAKTSEEPLTSEIQVRLSQGIQGYLSPRVISGSIFDKQNEIDVLYVANFRRGADPELVDRFYAIMIR